jgi:hypothetical protein
MYVHVCVYVSMHVCMYVCMYVDVSGSAKVCIPNICVHIYPSVCVCVHIRECMCVCVYHTVEHMHVLINQKITFICACMYVEHASARNVALQK